jgi:hypothetical protein
VIGQLGLVGVTNAFTLGLPKTCRHIRWRPHGRSRRRCRWRRPPPGQSRPRRRLSATPRCRTTRT